MELLINCYSLLVRFIFIMSINTFSKDVTFVRHGVKVSFRRYVYNYEHKIFARCEVLIVGLMNIQIC
jgi:hypothetical protein